MVLIVMLLKKYLKQKEERGDNPLIVHISCKEQIKEIAYVESEMEQILIDNFMPGPFTLILKKKECIPSVVSAGLDTVGIRMPQNKVAQELIKMAKIPIAAPSANISGRPSGTRIEDIKEELGEKVSAIIDAGNQDAEAMLCYRIFIRIRIIRSAARISPKRWLRRRLRVA